MTDAELIARLRDWMEHDEGKINDAREKAADRIEALIAERDEANKRGDAWRFRADIAEVKLAKAVEALEGLIQHTHNCEKELTEDLHHVDFCGESEPLTKARATLAEIKGESHE